MKKYKLWALCMLCMLCIASCSHVEDKETNTQQFTSEAKVETEIQKPEAQTNEDKESSSEEDKMFDVKTYMMEEYKLTAEELEGLDLDRLMKDYRFKDLDYTAQEVREILEDYGESYQLTPDSKVNALLQIESDRDLKESDVLLRLAVDYNYGSNEKKFLIDFKDRKIYSSGQELSIPEGFDQKEILKVLKGWEHEIEKPQDGSTASLGYTIVCELESGEYSSYHGFVQSEEDLPDGYQKIYDGLMK